MKTNVLILMACLLMALLINSAITYAPGADTGLLHIKIILIFTVLLFLPLATAAHFLKRR